MRHGISPLSLGPISPLIFSSNGINVIYATEVKRLTFFAVVSRPK